MFLLQVFLFVFEMFLINKMRILTRTCRLFYLSFNGHGAKATFQFCGHDNVSWNDYSQYGKMENVPNHQSDVRCFRMFSVNPLLSLIDPGHHYRTMHLNRSCARPNIGKHWAVMRLHMRGGAKLGSP